MSTHASKAGSAASSNFIGIDSKSEDIMAVETLPLLEGVAAEVRGVDLANLSDAEVSAITKAWQDYPVLLMRRQVLAEPEIIGLGRKFGEIERVIRKDMTSPFHPEINYISSLRYDNGKHLGALGAGELNWHTDQTYMKRPSTGVIFYGVEVPPEGGNTLFASQYAAYDSLSDETKQLIEGRMGIFSYAFRMRNYQQESTKLAPDTLAKKPDKDHPDERMDVKHPIILRHPETGRKTLYADCSTMESVEGLTAEQNQAIRAEFHHAATGHPEFVYEHRWRPGDVLFWDNGCVMHRRTPFSADAPRFLKRINLFLPADRFCVPHPS